MKKNLRVAIAQINCTVGDLDGNSRKITDWMRKAEGLGSDIIVFPELAITGYPPEDLLLKPKFIEDNIAALDNITKTVGDIIAVIGFVGKSGRHIYNSAAVIYKGSVKGIYHKMLLPNYGVFDEKRYFKTGPCAQIFKAGDIVFGVNICEDIWHDEGPLSIEASLGAKLMININASPYHAGKIFERARIIGHGAKATGALMVYTNLVGGQDEIVFDGHSMIIDPSGKVLYMAEAFEEDLLIADVSIESARANIHKNTVILSDVLSEKVKPELAERKIRHLGHDEEVYLALRLGLKDYVGKNGFKKVVMGLSGGIDSALVAAIASDSLGKDNVTGVFMPSRYSSDESRRDAEQVAKNLGIKYMNIHIDDIYKLYLNELESCFAGKPPDIAEENLQARIRGNILMALSNKFGWLVLATGNKSEMSTGYATLYGDMAGGLEVIKDVPKTLVYSLCGYRNTISSVIPESILTKAPTAELRPNQKDSDTLPPYEILDPILKAYVEEDKGLNEIVALGFEKETVSRVIDMIDNSEYKRRQSPPGFKITPKAFGKDRRMPITNKYK